MPLTFVFDETSLHGSIRSAITQHNQQSRYQIDCVWIGDSGWPLGLKDDELLKRAETAKRIVISSDVSTLPLHLEEHLETGGHSPGILFLREPVTISDLVEYLSLVAHCSEPEEWADRAAFVPA